MECRPLEIMIASAKDLKDVNLFTKMDVYAVVSINGDPYSTQKQKTHVHKDCGPNPNWNFTMKFNLDEASLQQNRLTLDIKLKSDRSLGDKDIGEVYVPIKELLDSAGDPKEYKHMSYSVSTPTGKAKGTLNFSYKFGDKQNAPPPKEKAKKVEEPVMAYPPAGYPNGAGASYPLPGGHPPPPPPPHHMDAGKAHAQPYPPQYAYPPQGGYPPQQYPPYSGYPPPQGYGYSGYPPQQGYGYGGPPVVQKPQKSGKGKLALGLGAGLLGGLLVGDMVSDIGDAVSYDAGFDDGFDF
ncbi:hypothetical protein K2173_027188 [Erythroxylum novogranatense]|uniref:C2 domain-containing protein n=1 Tax=Erythroxylum novogranatense TaxID=1862640 RepID=A0AAV8TYE8_9ROSI|nr:hypothetical protein K2173_027188 [Erythroxylum novogranatense]